MKHLMKLAPLAAASIATLVAAPSFADDQIVPVPVPVQQPAPQPTPVVVQQQPAVGTTQTTSAVYPEQSGNVQSSEKTMKTTPNGTFLSLGLGSFGLSYVSSVVAASVSTRDEDKNLYIPVVGPWVDLGNRNCTATAPCGNNESLAKAMIITSGVVQGAGALLMLGSFFIPEKTTVEERKSTAKVHFAPVSFGAGAGLGATGTF